MNQQVYLFDADLSGLDAKSALGGKGAGLNEMTRLGIPVPPGFTVGTEVCVQFQKTGALPDGVEAEVDKALAAMEAKVGRTLGDANDPLLVSVRSGARVSMPGMMDTILNLGLTDVTVEALAKASGDARFAFDAYRRLLQMYGDVVLGVPNAQFEETLQSIKREQGDPRMLDQLLDEATLRDLCSRYQHLISKHGEPFPQDVRAQLWGAIRAVFSSWNNARAIRYRKMQGIPHAWGTGCTVQAMVFGNMGDTSGSGVAFTRNPSTGERILYGEYLANAQGEDVVAGIRTPRALTAAAATPGREDETLERTMPAVFQKITEHCAALESHFGDMQDVEFTIEKGVPYILQTRTGKRTAHAAVRIAVELVHEGAIDKEAALLKVDPTSLEQLLHARLPSPKELEAQGVKALATGLPASPGAATGEVVFDADTAERMAAEGKDVLLVRRETSPEDSHGMKAARGSVTATGGMTSHAAVVARGLGTCCVAGCSTLDVDYQKQELRIRTDFGLKVYKAGDVLTLDGSHGKVYEGELDVVAAAKIAELDEFMEWADAVRKLRVRANCDTPSAARTARTFGAEGIGLCRTEHMFFADARLEAVRCAVLSETEDERAPWLTKIEPMQREDFEAIFRAMSGLPVTIRLLDPPLHEFLPHDDKNQNELASSMGVKVEAIKTRVAMLHEMNPMLGHRGCRLAVTYPEILRMQVRAITEAAIDCLGRGIKAMPEIMVPLVGTRQELALLRAEGERVIAEVKKEKAWKKKLDIKIGTMIEIPRAALTANEVAEVADFFSFGTNDLTQLTYGYSRDDVNTFLPDYIAQDILPVDPFQSLDQSGVGQLVELPLIHI